MGSSKANLICYTVDISGVMQQTKAFAKDQKLDAKTSGLLAVLVGMLYSNYPQTVSTALNAFNEAELSTPVQLFFLEKLADQVPNYVAAFNGPERSELEFFLCEILVRCSGVLPPIVAAKITVSAIALDAKTTRKEKKKKPSRRSSTLDLGPILQQPAARRTSSAMSILSLMRNGSSAFTSVCQQYSFRIQTQLTEDAKKKDQRGKITKTEEDTKSVASKICSSLVANVCRAKELASVESAFSAQSSISPALCRHIGSAADLLLETLEEKTVHVILMLLAKRIHVGSTYYSEGVEDTNDDGVSFASSGLQLDDDYVSRDVHAAISNLRKLLEGNVAFFTATEGRKYIMRRFVFVSIMELCASPWNRRFKAGLGLFLQLFNEYRSFMHAEIGAALDYIFVPMLQSPLCMQIDKRIALNVIKAVVEAPLPAVPRKDTGPAYSQFVDLYYNYDNCLSWRHGTVVSIFKALRGIIILEVDQMRAAQTQMRGYKAQIQVKWLQEKALKVLGDMIGQIVRFTGIGVFKDKNDRHRWKSLKTRVSRKQNGSAPKPGGVATATQATSTLNDPRDAAFVAAARRGSIMIRKEIKQKINKAFGKAYDKYRDLYQSEDADLKGKAVRYACKYLIRVGMGSPSQIADFLYQYSSKMNKVQIADYLATGDDTDLFHKDVRSMYMMKIDLSMVDFAKAFRIFVCDSGFHVGGLEAQRLNRMSACFADVYLRDNPDCGIHDAYGGDALAQSLLFIHTVKFNKASEPKGGGPQLPSPQEYVSMMRGQNKRRVNGELVEDDFSPWFLERQYKEILSKEIGFKGVSKSSSRKKRETKRRDIRWEARESFKKNIRKGFALLSARAALTREFHHTRDENLVSVLLDEVGYDVYTVCNEITERVALNPDTVGLVQLCLDICGNIIAVCIELDLQELMRWMLDVVGKRAWGLKKLERRSGNTNPLGSNPVIERVELKDQSAFQSLFWYKAIRLHLSKGRKEEAKQTILDEIESIKVKVEHLSHQTTLSKLQRSFGDTYIILSPHRRFVMKQRLLKVSETRKSTQDYWFFLFNDILVYANEKAANKYSVHRVLHLALCRLKEIDNSHFRIMSSQKSFTIRFPDKKSKNTWFQALTKYINEQILHTKNHHHHHNHNSSSGPGMPLRVPSDIKSSLEKPLQANSSSDRAVAENSNPEEQQDGSSDSRAANEPSFTSSSLRLSSPSVAKKNLSFLLKQGEWVCSLCLKKQGKRARNVQCAMCHMKVCKNCATHKVDRRPVCDCCYGQFELKFPDSASFISVSNSRATSYYGSTKRAGVNKPIVSVPNSRVNSRANMGAGLKTHKSSKSVHANIQTSEVHR
uniref:Uncharacterized protein n=2 Tax=Lotharella globosa TaxID=91324 RepID=A0A7S3YWE1_9EUKA